VPPRHHDVLFRDHRGARRPRTSLIGGRVPRVDRQSRAGGDVVSRQHPYCRRDTDQVVTLIGIAPLSVTGRVRLEGIGVRTTLWGEPDGPSDPDTHMVGIDRGIPAGVRSARGYNVPTCGSPDEPVGEVLVTLTMTAMKAEPLMVCGSHIAPTGGTMPSGARSDSGCADQTGMRPSVSRDDDHAEPHPDTTEGAALRAPPPPFASGSLVQVIRTF
jgi:hypothetical protein